ncbi:MAG: glycyl-radical enzyme activating protein [Thermincola sp.]|jgi:pyruvate formate lyase activating enzyme|nr:glycyl-radical enzyme activating protein [Thermincola sp.]MDT3704179.1 glycyl-radical enzyme activating protein [Thermincola sp.]
MTVKTTVFNIQRFSVHDGAGIRTTVFLKGCPLRCKWCCNPESISSAPELGLIRSRCNGCNKCTVICPEHALVTSTEKVLEVDRFKCTLCGECVKVCKAEAIGIYGLERTVEDVFQVVSRDIRYYASSGGGVTVSGGEATLQAPFVKELFRLCREAGISTCIETSGCVDPSSLAEILALTDMAFFDLKHMDPLEHQSLTGQSNEVILKNAVMAAEMGVDLRFRMPLIPTLNSGHENIAATARFIREIQGPAAAIELMPYHRLGSGKYEALDKEYSLKMLEVPDMDFINGVKSEFERLGVRCRVSL